MNSTLVLKPEESAEKQKNDIDLIAIAVDVLVPFVLDNFLFKGTKGRLMKLVGTVAAQQLIKMLAKSKTVDDILDQLEAWLQHPSKKPANPFPTIGDAVRQNSKKYRTRSKPEDYYDPEREMFY